jgi:putative DNA-invertase from lambdoid prophage Rac
LELGENAGGSNANGGLNMMHAYARVSTLDQSGPDKTSIAEQIAKCKAVAQLRGGTSKYDFMAHADNGVSGSTVLQTRPAGKEMWDQLRAGDIVIASKMDRIFRSGSDALATIDEFKKKKIGLILCDMGIEPVADSPVSTLFFSMLAAFAQFERERICERIMDGKRAKAKRGGHTGGPVPIGYRKIGAGAKGILVRNDAEQEHIAAARYHASRLPNNPSRVSALLAEEGMLGRDGKPYTRSMIHKMVSGRHSTPFVPGAPDRGPIENVFEVSA